jgi:hypothetical protein
MQTSGEVGRFYIDPESTGVKLGKRPLQLVRRTVEPQFNLGLSFPEPANLKNSAVRQETGRSAASSRLGSEAWPSGRGDFRRESARDNSEHAPSSSTRDSTQYMATLQRLDKSFSNSSRRDLFAASMPARPAQELVWCASNNNKGSQATKGWAEKLRRDSSA